MICFIRRFISLLCLISFSNAFAGAGVAAGVAAATATAQTNQQLEADIEAKLKAKAPAAALATAAAPVQAAPGAAAVPVQAAAPVQAAPVPAAAAAPVPPEPADKTKTSLKASTAQELVSIIKSNPNLANILKGSCKDSDPDKISARYISKGSKVTEDQDAPGSRMWNIANLYKDLASLVAAKSKDATYDCIKDLSDASINEQTRYWLARKEAADCASAKPPSQNECNWVDHNLENVVKQVESRVTYADDAKAKALAPKAATGKLEACPGGCASTDKPASDASAVANKAVATACCDVFKKRDGELTEKQCSEMHDGTQRIADRDNWSCAADIGKSIIMGIWTSLKSVAEVVKDVAVLAWNSIFNHDSVIAGFGTIYHEFEKDPAEFGKIILQAILKGLTGYDSSYADCLHESQKGKFYCEIAGTTISQIGMIAGGWAAITKILKAGGIAALKLSLKATTKIPGVVKGTEKVKAIAATVAAAWRAAPAVEGAARPASDMELLARDIRAGVKDAAGKTVIKNPELLDAKRSLGRLLAEKQKLIAAQATANQSELENIAGAIMAVEHNIEKAQGAIRTIVAAEKPATDLASLNSTKKNLVARHAQAQDPALKAEIAQLIAAKESQIADAAKVAAETAVAAAAKTVPTTVTAAQSGAGAAAATSDAASTVANAGAAAAANSELIIARKSLKAAQDQKRYLTKKAASSSTSDAATTAKIEAAEKRIAEAKTTVQNLKTKATVAASTEQALLKETAGLVGKLRSKYPEFKAWNDKLRTELKLAREKIAKTEQEISALKNQKELDKKALKAARKIPGGKDKVAEAERNLAETEKKLFGLEKDLKIIESEKAGYIKTARNWMSDHMKTANLWLGDYKYTKAAAWETMQGILYFEEVKQSNIRGEAIQKKTPQQSGDHTDFDDSKPAAAGALPALPKPPAPPAQPAAAAPAAQAPPAAPAQ